MKEIAQLKLAVKMAHSDQVSHMNKDVLFKVLEKLEKMQKQIDEIGGYKCQ